MHRRRLLTVLWQDELEHAQHTTPTRLAFCEITEAPGHFRHRAYSRGASTLRATREFFSHPLGEDGGRVFPNGQLFCLPHQAVIWSDAPLVEDQLNYETRCKSSIDRCWRPQPASLPPQYLSASLLSSEPFASLSISCRTVQHTLMLHQYARAHYADPSKLSCEHSSGHERPQCM